MTKYGRSETWAMDIQASGVTLKQSLVPVHGKVGYRPIPGGPRYEEKNELLESQANVTLLQNRLAGVELLATDNDLGAAVLRDRPGNSMNWDMISANAEIAGAIAVVVTLYYLAFQIRESSAESRRNRWNELHNQISRVADNER